MKTFLSYFFAFCGLVLSVYGIAELGLREEGATIFGFPSNIWSLGTTVLASVVIGFFLPEWLPALITSQKQWAQDKREKKRASEQEKQKFSERNIEVSNTLLEVKTTASSLVDKVTDLEKLDNELFPIFAKTEQQIIDEVAMLKDLKSRHKNIGKLITSRKEGDQNNKKLKDLRSYFDN